MSAFADDGVAAVVKIGWSEVADPAVVVDLVVPDANHTR